MAVLYAYACVWPVWVAALLFPLLQYVLCCVVVVVHGESRRCVAAAEPTVGRTTHAHTSGQVFFLLAGNQRG